MQILQTAQQRFALQFCSAPRVGSFSAADSKNRDRIGFRKYPCAMAKRDGQEFPQDHPSLSAQEAPSLPYAAAAGGGGEIAACSASNRGNKGGNGGSDGDSDCYCGGGGGVGGGGGGSS